MGDQGNTLQADRKLTANLATHPTGRQGGSLCSMSVYVHEKRLTACLPHSPGKVREFLALNVHGGHDNDGSRMLRHG